LTSVGFGVRWMVSRAQDVAARITNDGTATPLLTDSPQVVEEKRDSVLTAADRLAASYDYDGAIALIEAHPAFQQDTVLVERVAHYQTVKATLVPVDPQQVTHIFYHSLINDPELCFADHDYNPAKQGANQWLTTVDEFNKITQEMYDRGFVLVGIHDLVQETVDQSGRTVFTPAQIMLPPDKRAFVLSIDDVSYYHNYSEYTCASKLVLDEDGSVTCEYTDRDGVTVYGAYDVVPLLDRFIEEHPDASYRGAKGIIALTGYNGVLGYRTDETYDWNHPQLDGEQRAYLAAHPDFDRATECAQATAVADAMKADGWEFANHSWGHINTPQSALGWIVEDNERWVRNVEPIVGPVDTLIFAFGADAQPWGLYDLGEAKVAYYYSQGYRIFCGVTFEQSMVLITEDYMRMNRRNIDGYRLYYNTIGVAADLYDLFDPGMVLDPYRPPVAPLVSYAADHAEEKAAE